MTPQQRSWLLPPAALVLVAGVFIGRDTSVLFWPLFALFAAVVSVIFLRDRLRFLACLALSFALGVSAGALSFHPRLPAEQEYDVRAIVSDEVSEGPFGQVRVYLSDVQLDGRSFSGGAYWTFYSDQVPEELQPGMETLFRASLYHPRSAVNPEGYDFREALLQRGVTVCLYGDENLLFREPSSFSFSGWLASLRHSLSLSLVRTLGEETGAYASALLLGLRSLIPSKDRQAFSRLGIAHVLSVSGFHVGILIGALALLFRLLRLPSGLRILLHALLLFLYAGLCGMSQPVIRASLLLLLSLEGKLLHRPRSGLHLLSAVLIIMVLLSPVQVTSASFQMTFLAMLGLIWFSPAATYLKNLLPRIPGRLVELTVLTFGCQLGLLLPELLFFQRLPLLVFLINIPATLIFSGLISLFWLVLLLLPLPGIAGFLSVPLSSLTGLLLSGIRSLGSLPGLTLWIHTPTWLTILGVVLLFGAACFLVRFRRFLRLSLAVLGSLFLFLSLLPVSHTATEYILFSAGNADAALLWDRERVIVLDTGENDGTLSTFLRANRLTPDAVILSHLHADHAGGLVSMLDDGIPVPLLYLPEGADRQDIHPDFLTLLDRLRSEGTEIRFLARGDVLPLPSGNMSVLWPERNKVRSGQDANDYSLVTRLTLRGSVLLSAADLPGTYESYCAAPADILKAAHHGSRSSTADSFLQQVSPSLVLLSCRQDARLEDFRARVGDIPVFGTPESGAITLRFEENGFSFLPFVSSP